MEERWYSCLERRTMKFTHVLSILCVGIIAPYMIASEPADIEQAYKKEVAKVKQADKKTVKDKKAKAIKPAQEKKTKKSVTHKTTKKEQPQKTKATRKKASTKATKTEKKAVTSKKQPTKQVTPKTTRTKKQKTVKHEPVQETQVTERVTRRAPNIETLEPRTVLVGEEFTITRPASPNFGRIWKLHKALPTQIEMVGKEKFVPAEHPSRNEGTLVFTFKATQPGLTSIEFEKVYPPELRDKKPMKVRIVPVEIKEFSTK